MLNTSFALLAVVWLAMAVGGLSLGIMADINQANAPAFPLLPVLVSQLILNVGAVIFSKFIGVTQIDGYKWYMPFMGGQSFVILTGVSLTIVISCSIGIFAYFFSTFYGNPAYGILTIQSLAILGANCMHLVGLMLFEKNSPKQWSWLTRLSSPPNRETAIVGFIAGSIIFVALRAEQLTSIRTPLTFVCLLLHVGCGITVHVVIGWKLTPNYRLFMPFPSKRIFSLRNLAQCGVWLLWILMLQSLLALLFIPPSEAPPYVYSMSGLTSALSIVALLVYVRTFSLVPPHSASLLANNGSQVLTAFALLLAAEIAIAGAIAERPELLPFNQDTLVDAPFLQSKVGGEQFKGAGRTEAATIAGFILGGLSDLLVLSPEAHLLKFTEGTLAAIDASQQICATFLIAVPPATHLIGSLMHGPTYNTFQPFKGNVVFVCLQGLGWALYAFALFFLVLSIAINKEDEVHRMWLTTFAYTMFGAQMVILASVKAFTNEDSANIQSSSAHRVPSELEGEERDGEDEQLEEDDGNEDTTPIDNKRSRYLLSRRRRLANDMKLSEALQAPQDSTAPSPVDASTGLPPTVKKASTPSGAPPTTPNQAQRFFNGEMVVSIILAMTGFIMRFVCDNLLANALVAAAQASKSRTANTELDLSEHTKAIVPAMLMVSTGFLAVATPVAHIAHRQSLSRAVARWGNGGRGSGGNGNAIQGFVTGVMQGPKEATALQTIGWSIYAVMLVMMTASCVEPLSLEPQFLPYTLEALAALVPFFFVTMSMYVLLTAAVVRQVVRREAILDLKHILNTVISDPLARNEVGNRIDWLLQVVTGNEGGGSSEYGGGEEVELDEDGNPTVPMRFGGDVLFEAHHEYEDRTNAEMESLFSRRPSGSESDDEGAGMGNTTESSEAPSPAPPTHVVANNKALAQTFATLSSSIGARVNNSSPHMASSHDETLMDTQPAVMKQPDTPLEIDIPATHKSSSPIDNTAALSASSASSPNNNTTMTSTQPYSFSSSYGKSSLSASARFSSTLGSSTKRLSTAGAIQHNTSAALLLSQLVGFTLLAYIVALVQKGKRHPLALFLGDQQVYPTNQTPASDGLLLNFMSQPRSEILATLFTLGGVLLMTVSAVTTQTVYGPFIHGSAFKFAMPFRGGFSFVALQSVGWGLFSASWLLFLLNALGMAHGSTPLVIGCLVSIAAQVTIFVSIPYFRTRTRPSTFVEENSEAVIAILTFVIAFSLTRTAETVAGSRASALSILISTVALCIAMPLAAVALKKSGDAYGKRHRNDLEEEEEVVAELTEIEHEAIKEGSSFFSPSVDPFSPSPASPAASPRAAENLPKGKDITPVKPPPARPQNFRRTDEQSEGATSMHTETATYASSHLTRGGSSFFEDPEISNSNSVKVKSKALKLPPPIAHIRKTASLLLEEKQKNLSPPLVALEYMAFGLVAQFPLLILFLGYYSFYNSLNNYANEVASILSAGWIMLGIFTALIFVVVFSRTRYYQATMECVRTYILFLIPMIVVCSGFALPVILPSFGTKALAITIILLTFFPGKWRIFVGIAHWMLLAFACCYHGNKAFHFFANLLSVRLEPTSVQLDSFDSFLAATCDLLSGVGAFLIDALPLLLCSWYGKLLTGRPEIDGSHYRPSGLRLCYAELFSYTERFFDVRVLADDLELTKKAQRIHIHHKRRASLSNANTPLLKKDPKTPLTTTRMSGGAIIGFHPHGVFPVTVLWFHFTRRWERMFGGCPRVVAHGASIIFQTPILRDVAMTVGTRCVTKSAIEKVISEGLTPMIVPGGQAEMISSKISDTEMHIVTYHIGFIRIAMNHKRAVIPLISFGENNVMGNVHFPKMQAFFLKKMGFGFPVLPLGKWNLPVPLRAQLRIAVGKPVYPEEGEDDATNPLHVNKVADKYFAELREVFYRYREEAGYPNMELYFHSDKHDPLKGEVQTPRPSSDADDTSDSSPN